MSLRRDIHSAFEVITPPPGGMPERVVQTVLAEKNGRLRKERMVYRLRFSLALVAAVLLVAVAVAAIMTWNSLHSNISPAGGVHLSPLQQLEARPLQLPTSSPGAPCPSHVDLNNYNFAYGGGPVYANGGPAIPTAWGHFYDVTYFTDPGLKGPVLIRGHDLQGSARLAFVSSRAVGPVEGTDSSQSPSVLKTEMVLDPSKPPAKWGTFGKFAVRQGIARSWQGCFGVQIDGPTFTELIYGFDPSWSS